MKYNNFGMETGEVTKKAPTDVPSASNLVATEQDQKQPPNCQQRVWIRNLEWYKYKQRNYFMQRVTGLARPLKNLKN